MNAIEKLKGQIAYHEKKLAEFQKVYKLVTENPQMELALSKLLDALEDVSII